MNQRQLFSVESEQAVIGAMLLDNSAYDKIADRITERDFSRESHRVLFRHLSGQIAAGLEADATTLVSALAAADDTDRAGGDTYIASILQNTPSSRNILVYAQVVIDHRIERDLASAAAEMADLAAGEGTVQQRLDAAQALLSGLTDNTASDDPEQIGGILPRWVEELEKRMELDGAISGLETGLTDLDEKTSGLQDGDLILIAARPSMGKTSLAMQIARHTATVRRKSALVFSLEMSKSQLTQLSVAALGRVSSTKLRSGKVRGDDWDGISAGIGKLHESKLFIDDRTGLSVNQMRARARRLKRKHGLDLIVVDYIQLMGGGGENRNQEISEISRGLKLMARELNVPVVALSQLSRKCEERSDKRPLMADLRDSGALEQDADVIIFVYRDEVYHPDSEFRGMAELIIGKQRMGETGAVRTTWLGEYNTFENFTGIVPDRPVQKFKNSAPRPFNVG